MKFTQKASNVRDVPLEKLVQDRHMLLLAEENVVRQVLNDLRYHHQPAADVGMGLRYLHVHDFGRNNGRRDESADAVEQAEHIVRSLLLPQKHERPKSSELGLWPDMHSSHVSQLNDSR